MEQLFRFFDLAACVGIVVCIIALCERLYFSYTVHKAMERLSKIEQALVEVKMPHILPWVIALLMCIVWLWTR